MDLYDATEMAYKRGYDQGLDTGVKSRRKASHTTSIIALCITLIIIIAGVLLFLIYHNKINESVSAATSWSSSNGSQPGTYFPAGEDRFILVDESKQYIGGQRYFCKVFADKYMLTMYLMVNQGGVASMTQIFYEDGSPMIYDPTEEELAEWEK